MQTSDPPPSQDTRDVTCTVLHNWNRDCRRRSRGGAEERRHGWPVRAVETSWTMCAVCTTVQHCSYNETHCSYSVAERAVQYRKYGTLHSLSSSALASLQSASHRLHTQLRYPTFSVTSSSIIPSISTTSQLSSPLHLSPPLSPHLPYISNIPPPTPLPSLIQQVRDNIALSSVFRLVSSTQ